MHWLTRIYQVLFPKAVPKSQDAIRFGILGAANIGPLALILPAKTHPEVIIAAVAARDIKRGEAYAKKNDIPIVHKSYEDLIADPSITAIYVPLPNGLHYEWAIKALEAGKHVLLEKPCVSNAEEARSLFRHPVLSQPNAPVLLEAFHYRFHPSWQTFLSLFKPEDVAEAQVLNYMPKGMFSISDIRFNYSLSGGTLMDLGSYALSALRQVFRADPTAIKAASHGATPEGGDKDIDFGIFATYEFANGGIGKIESDLMGTGGYWFPSLTKNWPRTLNGFPPKLWVELKPKVKTDEGGTKRSTKRKLIFHNYMGPQLYHRLDIIDTTETFNRGDEKVTNTTKETRYLKAYQWPEKGPGKVGEDSWSTYRHQLEEFVNRVKGRQGSGVWIEGEDSVQQMEIIDKTYAKAGLPLRPTSTFLSSAS